MLDEDVDDVEWRTVSALVFLVLISVAMSITVDLDHTGTAFGCHQEIKLVGRASSNHDDVRCDRNLGSREGRSAWRRFSRLSVFSSDEFSRWSCAGAHCVICGWCPGLLLAAPFASPPDGPGTNRETKHPPLTSVDIVSSGPDPIRLLVELRDRGFSHPSRDLLQGGGMGTEQPSGIRQLPPPRDRISQLPTQDLKAHPVSVLQNHHPDVGLVRDRRPAIARVEVRPDGAKNPGSSSCRSISANPDGSLRKVPVGRSVRRSPIGLKAANHGPGPGHGDVRPRRRATATGVADRTTPPSLDGRRTRNAGRTAACPRGPLRHVRRND